MKPMKKTTYLEFAGLLLPLLLALICVYTSSSGVQQSSLPIPMPQSFIGEYSYDREVWLPLTEEAELSALKGDLYLRGRFERDMAEGQVLRYFRNHIGVTVRVNGETVFVDDLTEAAAVGGRLFAGMCGQEWDSMNGSGITAQDEIEIILHNPHRMGNESAYRDFLSTLCGDLSGIDLLPKNLEPFSKPMRMAGGLFAIASLMILGASVASVIARVPVGGKLLKPGLLVLFAGGYFYFDTVDICFRGESVVFNTCAKQLCMMLAVLLAGQFVSDSLTGKKRAAAKTALGASSLLNAALIAAALTGRTAIFDTLPFWAGSQLLLCPLLFVFCAMELRHAASGRRLIPATGLLLSAGVVLDLFNVGESFFWRSPCTKLLFAALFTVHLLDAARSIVLNHRATLRAETLEKELEDSRISIMLSQIQPHFLYNVLGTIRGLCREDPMRARQALDDFSDYLRGNMNALTNSRTIPFSREIRHIEAYLRLEKMRMGSGLNILYDLQETDFSLPPLTIQPLVENAVKHGLFEKGGGTLILHTRREDGQIIISVQDDGVGFDPAAPLPPDERHAHVGLSNVRSRLEKISGGRLTIDAAPGRGTTSTVFLTAQSNENGGNSAQ